MPSKMAKNNYSVIEECSIAAKKLYLRMVKLIDAQNLEIWKISMELTTKIYKLTETFPKEEIYGITSQIRRCAVSIPSNIAEGKGRRTNKDFINFLYIAKGSLNELQTQIIIANNLEYIKEEDKNQIIKISEALRIKIIKLINYLQKS
jgi:four helix bundle protein